MSKALNLQKLQRRKNTGSTKKPSLKNSITFGRKSEKGSSVNARKKSHWNKTEEVLSHLALVGLGDGVPSTIQQLVRQKITASRKALQLRSDPLEITKPLLDLADVINDYGVSTSSVINQELNDIRILMVEATREKFEHRAKETSKSPRTKDVKGIEMKKKLDQAKSILSRMSDLNELKITVKNSVEMILKASGYITDVQSSTSGAEAEVDKLGLKENAYETKKSCNWKKIEGVLDHVMRVCQRPNIPRDLQRIMMSKISSSRKSLHQRSDPLKISKPLHQLIDILNDHGLESSEVIKTHLEDIQNLSEPTGDNAETAPSEVTSRDLTGLEMRKVLGQAKTYLNYLSDLNELKMIIKNSADLIQRGGAYTIDELPALLSAMEKDEFDLTGLVKELDETEMPQELKTAVKITLTAVKSVLKSPPGRDALLGPLEVLSASIHAQVPDQVAKACNVLLGAVNEYNMALRRKILNK